jgi:hypothetical protein
MQVRPGEVSDGMPKRRGQGGTLLLLALLLPRTRMGWFVLFSVLIFIWAPLPLLLYLAALVFMLIVAAVMGRGRTVRVAGTFLLAVFGFYASTQVIYLVTALLALLAGNGASFTAIYSDTFYINFVFGELLLLVIIWLLLGIPNQAHKLELDIDGTAGVRGLVVGLLTAVACALTGGYIWLTHYSLLANVHTSQLVAGIIFTVALVPPYYASLARACWKRGLSGVLSPKPLVERWRQLVTEVQNARVAEVRRAHAEASRAENVASDRLGWLDRILRWLYTYERRSAAAVGWQISR